GCGYDKTGADDEAVNHLFYKDALRRRLSLSSKNHIQNFADAPVNDIEDTAVIEDNGSIVMPPNDFDLNGRSILFEPSDGGYRIVFSNDRLDDALGERLSGFVGVDGEISDSDNGYREVELSGAPAQFFGQTYDRVFVGTNGYITFGQGDATARLSPSSLATDLPRLAPLWADLVASHKGRVYYNRASDRHVFTWKKMLQPIYSGKSTFQTILFDDGRIEFLYGGVNVHAALVGLSPGATDAPRPLDLSRPPADTQTGAIFEL